MKKKCKLIVLVPVLNEAENVDQLVKKIFKKFLSKEELLKAPAPLDTLSFWEKGVT